MVRSSPEVDQAIHQSFYHSLTYYVHRTLMKFDDWNNRVSDGGLFYVFICQACIDKGKKFFIPRVARWEKVGPGIDAAINRLEAVNRELDDRTKQVNKLVAKKAFLEQWLVNLETIQ